MTNYRKYFQNKKITVHGLGLLGRGIGDVIFLAQQGANLIVTDLKTEEQLASSLAQIKKALKPEIFKKIKFVLGEHRLEDFSAQGGSASGRKPDFILKSAGVPLDSPFIKEAEKNKIPIKMDASWFVELVRAECPEGNQGIKIIGVTGTRGKSTVTHLIFNIIEEALRASSTKSKINYLGKRHPKVFLGGNVRGLATLPLLNKVKSGDFVVMELDSWQLQGFGDAQISPNISVFTNLMRDHQNYYSSTSLATGLTGMELYFTDKANIYRWQKNDDIIIVGQDIAKRIKQDKPKGKFIIINDKNFPVGWKTKLLGKHNLFNLALAIAVARALKIQDSVIKKTVANFNGVSGRLEFLRTVKGVEYYNDTTATTPDGVIAALKALPSVIPSGTAKIILIGGGRDKELDYKNYASVVKKSVKALALFTGTGTDKIIKALGLSTSLKVDKTRLPVKVFDNMKEAFTWANSFSKKGDIVLLSPGAASFGIFKNEFDRGDQFVSLVKKVK